MDMGSQINFTHDTDQRFGGNVGVNNLFCLLDDLFQLIKNSIKILFDGVGFKRIGHPLHASLYEIICHTRFFFIGSYSPKESVKNIGYDHGKIGHFAKILGLFLFDHPSQGI